MSASNFEWIFNNSDVNLGSNLQDEKLNFKKTYDNSQLTGDGVNYYNINDYQSIIYTDLESILHNESFTLSLTLKESFTDISKSGNLFTLGYHTRGSKNTCITVGRKAATGEVVLGTINDLITLKGNSLSTSNIIQSDTQYEFVVVHNNFEREQNQFNLFIKDNTNTYSLISDSSGLKNISILQPKLFIGSSLWTNEPEWNNQFDLCDVTLTSNIQLTVGKTIYPVDILIYPISDSNLTNPDTTEIQIDEQFLIKLFSRIRFSKSSVKVYVTSTTDGHKLLECVNFVVNGIEDYEYHFTGIVDNNYNNSFITYSLDLNGTISSYESTTLSVITSVSLPLPAGTEVYKYTDDEWTALGTGKITVELQGGDGGNGGRVSTNSYRGGKGGYITVNIDVFANEIYTITVGQNGTTNTNKRFGGGGGGGSGFKLKSAANWMVIAGGGGGGADKGYGGDGGNGNSQNGFDGFHTKNLNYRGRGGEQNAGGASGGTNGTKPPTAGTKYIGGSGVSESGSWQGSTGGDGQGNGGEGGWGSGDYGGGGGGGGWYGGGGGGLNDGSGGGGGGGSTYFDELNTNIELTSIQSPYVSNTTNAGFVKIYNAVYV
jgi:hypothetical protein